MTLRVAGDCSDLKAENILLDKEGHVRLSDFGLSHQTKGPKDRVLAYSGTATYMAPELLLDKKGKGHTRSVDIWCFGVLLFIMLAHEPPFWARMSLFLSLILSLSLSLSRSIVCMTLFVSNYIAETTDELFDDIKHKEIDWEIYREELSPDALSLLQGLLTKDVSKRLGCGKQGILEIKRHPFFADVDWDAVVRKQTTAPRLLPVAKKSDGVQSPRNDVYVLPSLTRALVHRDTHLRDL